MLVTIHFELHTMVNSSHDLRKTKLLQYISQILCIYIINALKSITNTFFKG